MSRASLVNRDKLHGTVAHRRAKSQEKRIALRGGGARVPGSGSGDQKGDVKKFNGILRIECKNTANKSFSVTQKMLDSIEEAALPNGELPAIVIEFIDHTGKLLRDCAVVPLYVLDSIKGDDDGA
jgi:hypothetical protein